MLRPISINGNPFPIAQPRTWLAIKRSSLLIFIITSFMQSSLIPLVKITYSSSQTLWWLLWSSSNDFYHFLSWDTSFLSLYYFLYSYKLQFIIAHHRSINFTYLGLNWINDLLVILLNIIVVRVIGFYISLFLRGYHQL